MLTRRTLLAATPVLAAGGILAPSSLLAGSRLQGDFTPQLWRIHVHILQPGTRPLVYVGMGGPRGDDVPTYLVEGDAPPGAPYTLVPSTHGNFKRIWAGAHFCFSPRPLGPDGEPTSHDDPEVHYAFISGPGGSAKNAMPAYQVEHFERLGIQAWCEEYPSNARPDWNPAGFITTWDPANPVCSNGNLNIIVHGLVEHGEPTPADFGDFTWAR